MKNRRHTNVPAILMCECLRGVHSLNNCFRCAGRDQTNGHGRESADEHASHPDSDERPDRDRGHDDQSIMSRDKLDESEENSRCRLHDVHDGGSDDACNRESHKRWQTESSY